MGGARMSTRRPGAPCGVGGRRLEDVWRVRMPNAAMLGEACSVGERPDERDLLDLQEKSLQALVKAVSGTYGNDWRKPRLALRLL